MINHPNRKKANKVSTGAAAPTPKKPKPYVPPAQHHHDYSGLLTSVRESFHAAVLRCDAVPPMVFDTDATDLWGTFLSMIAPGEVRLRQVHNCHCCRRFVQTYGGLVTIDASGDATPVMWGMTTRQPPNFYADAFIALWHKVKRAKVTNIFLTEETTWGTPQTGEWTHMSVVPPAALVHRNKARTPFQATAVARDNVLLVCQAMVDYPPAVRDEALRLFEAGVLDRSEKFVGPVKWLRNLHDWPKGRQNQEIRNNILWRAVATAPEGYSHIKASVVAPLLDDIQNRVPFEVIKAKHGAKVLSDLYQRAQVAPAAGNVAAAEQLFEKLGLAPALERRFATLEDLDLSWVSSGVQVDSVQGVGGRAAARRAGVFGQVRLRYSAPSPSSPVVNMPPITMTWDKFNLTVLPKARRIDAKVEVVDGFFALTAATDADAPPLIRWDREDFRNTVSWYTYIRFTPASQWKLSAGWTPVSAVAPSPNLWGPRPSPQHGRSAFLILDGAVDQKNDSVALFPEHIRDDLFAARATIEGFSKVGKLSGADNASACGFCLREGGGSFGRVLRVHDGNAWTTYTIDRWD